MHKMRRPHASGSYTPASFLDAFPELVVRQGPATHSVSLTLGPSTAFLSNIDACTSSVAVTVSFYGKPVEGVHKEENPLLQRFCVIAAHPSQLTARWCCELQRVFSVAASLPFYSRESTTYSADNSVSCLGEAPVTSAPFNALSDSFSEFHVRLLPYLPEMHYVRSLDGILGSPYYCMVTGTVEWVRGRSKGTKRQTDSAKDGNANAAHEGGDGGHGGAAVGEASYTASPAAAAATTSTSISTCRVAAMVNANIPTPRESPAEADATCAVAAIRPSIALAILHAPGRCLMTAASDLATVGQKRHRDNGEEAVPLTFMQSFTSHILAPYITLRALDGAWDVKPQDSVTDSRAPTGSRGTDVVALTALDDNVCGVAAVATSYRVLLHAHKRLSHGQQTSESRVRNIVLVVDLPMVLWRKLYHCYGGRCCASPSGSRGAVAETEETLVQLGSLIDRALLQLAAENIDLFATYLSSSKGGGDRGGISTSGTTAGSNANSTAVATGTIYTGDVLMRSIAESIADIIGRSRNPDFVRAAEERLFGTAGNHRGNEAAAAAATHVRPSGARPAAASAATASGPLRYSAAEMRWAIEEKLHRYYDSGQRKQY